VAELRPGDRALQFAAIFFGVGALWHNLDHARRGTGTLSNELVWVGRAGIVLAAMLIVMALMRHRFAPHAAAVGGMVLALGFVGAHWLPTWSVFSDSFVEGDAAFVSQAASMLEILGALVFAATGLYALRARRPAQRVLSPTSAA
jgi:hypothetical protein